MLETAAYGHMGRTQKRFTKTFSPGGNEKPLLLNCLLGKTRFCRPSKTAFGL
jgi:hypothetical protein